MTNVYTCLNKNTFTTRFGVTTPLFGDYLWDGIEHYKEDPMENFITK